MPPLSQDIIFLSSDFFAKSESRHFKIHMAFKKQKAKIRRWKLRRAGVSPEPNLVDYTPVNDWDGWPVPKEGLSQESIVYSIGLGDDIMWDLELISRHNLQLFGFDPTPESTDWISKQDLPDNFSHHPKGLAAEDGHLSLFPPKKEGRINFTQEKLAYVKRCHEKIEIPVNRLSTLMNELSHQHIDILKIDIEGSEFEALPDIFASGCSFTHLMVEIHYQFPTRSFGQGLDLIAKIRGQGYRCYYISPRGYEFAFIKNSPK